VKHVAAHIKVSQAVYDALAHEVPPVVQLFAIRGYEVRIDNAVPDDQCEIVDAYDIKPFRFIRPGSRFWWGDTLYVNPHDERLQ
jgi:hypothetical protein